MLIFEPRLPVTESIPVTESTRLWIWVITLYPYILVRVNYEASWYLFGRLFEYVELITYSMPLEVAHLGILLFLVAATHASRVVISGCICIALALEFSIAGPRRYKIGLNRRLGPICPDIFEETSERYPKEESKDV